ncbi:ALK tyrosine kinase receptor-like [Penaeus monodon]|uniref:ALK tyrosine kinase receptor-like n=1 Tax=Penaeus monodon TaxID=6687 RepID=UPI0018A777CD|nr:ALK tyrosine kinase receptor-like [Penaeus monodon]
MQDLVYNLDQIHGDKGDLWHRASYPLPAGVHNTYKIVVSNVRGSRYYGDLAFDDFSLSQECFGKGVPPEALICPTPPATDEAPIPTFTTYTPPEGKEVWVVTTCGATGQKGPTAKMCSEAYQRFKPPLPAVLPSSPLPGTQTFKIPRAGYYTVIAKGASGGAGVQTEGLSTQGAVARGTFFFKADTELYILVGQEGMSACKKDQAVHTAEQRDICNKKSPPDLDGFDNPITKIRLASVFNQGGGGGGGGASYVFMMDPITEAPKPLVVGGGGAGLAWTPAEITPLQHGRPVNISLYESHGHAFYNNTETGAGPGGGWIGNRKRGIEGQSLVHGGMGGDSCVPADTWNTYGGFGGGGGGCMAGGGGGGYTGGNAYSGPYRHGEGGYSYTSGEFQHVTTTRYKGPGVVYIIPAVRGDCGCDYMCVYLDENLREKQCICAEKWILSTNNYTCISETSSLLWHTTYPIIICLFIFVIVLISTTSICCYNRYQRKKFVLMRREFSRGPDDQLHTIRAESRRMVTEYNPNYEFGGGTCTIKDLKEIPRENLTLVKALGQGAFGEVYQGYLKNYAGDSVEMPVAVKTLPEMSSNQAEMDFLMEALIMSKFDHPNIVHFIGVCFDKLPRFIVLELLSGGDLKSFLREARPKPDRPSALTMRDLLTCAMDVAKGCEYLEENHFIHRDIAARNCLLTTKGPGRVVKIADFGMARDIYRNDYYRKGGKAMLPVKWMPPEAFLDGIFTSKTDVW